MEPDGSLVRLAFGKEEGKSLAIEDTRNSIVKAVMAPLRQ